MKVSLAFLKYFYFFVREKTVKHFLCWKKFQFPGLGSNHPIPTLIEVLTQTANNQNAFFQNMLSAYIKYMKYLLLHYARLIFVQVIPWQSYQLQPQNRVQRDTEEEIKVYSAQIGTITRQSPVQIHLISFLFEKYQTNAASAAFHFPFANYLTTHINIKRSKSTWQHFKLRW